MTILNPSTIQFAKRRVTGVSGALFSLFATYLSLVTPYSPALAAGPSMGVPDTRPTFTKELVGDRADNPSRQRDFFEKGSATSIFQDPVRLTQQPTVNMLVPRSKEPPPEELAGGAALNPSKAQPVLSPKEKLMQDFGDPTADAPVLGDEKAPKPFKAMLGALQLGDKELAYKYARQYVRYMKTVKDRVNLTNTITDYASQREGLKPKKDTSEVNDYTGFKDIYERDLAAVKEEGSKTVTLDGEAQKLIREVDTPSEQLHKQALQGAAPQQKQPAKAKSEAEERAMVRARLGGNIPVDRDGRATVYLFFHVHDTESYSMVYDLSKLYREVKESQKVEVKAMLLSKPSVSALQSFIKITKMNFPVADGVEFGRQLGVSRSPSLVVVAPSSGQAAVEEGRRSYFYMDELIKIVQGLR
jgi:hypothetical protein